MLYPPGAMCSFHNMYGKMFNITKDMPLLDILYKCFLGGLSTV